MTAAIFFEFFVTSPCIFRTSESVDPQITRQGVAMAALLQIQEDFKEGLYTKDETYLRYQDWLRTYPPETRTEKKVKYVYDFLLGNPI